MPLHGTMIEALAADPRAVLFVERRTKTRNLKPSARENRPCRIRSARIEIEVISNDQLPGGAPRPKTCPYADPTIFSWSKARRGRPVAGHHCAAAASSPAFIPA